MRIVLCFILLTATATPSLAQQLSEPGEKERYVGLFFFKPTDGDWVGAISSRGTWTYPTSSTPPVRWDVTWQFDYGTFGGKRVTPSATIPTKETDVSKNSGSYTLNFWGGRSTSVIDWRWQVSGGLENKRVQDAPAADIRHVNGAIGRLAAILSGSKAAFADRTVCGGPSSVPIFQVDYRGVGALTTAKAVMSDAERQEEFADATAEVWLNLWPALNEGDCKKEPVVWHRIVVAASGVASAGFGDVPDRSSLDASISFFVTENVGFRLRRFKGYFDHNLRDRKDATTAMLVVRF